jgi:YidC/Oxa1 family membrane protein insertase
VKDVHEMSDQVRGIIFVVIALVILFIWQHFFKPPVPPPQSTNTPAAQTVPAQSAPAKSPGAAISAAAARAPVIPAAAQAEQEKTVVVESGFYRVELSNRGAVVRSWKLQKYFDDQKKPQPLDLVNSDSAQQLGWPFSVQLSDAQQTQQANTALYQVDAPDESPLRAPTQITFHWSDGHLAVTKKLTFAQDYEMSAEVDATLDGRPVPVALAWRGGFGDKEVYKASSLVTVFYKQNGKLTLLQYKKLGVSGNQTQAALQTGPMEFVGIEDQFFTASFLPDGTDLSLWHWTENHNIVEDGKPATETVAEMAAGSPTGGPLKVRLFVGPKVLGVLARQRPPLEVLVQFGWTGNIAKLITSVSTTIAQP